METEHAYTEKKVVQIFTKSRILNFDSSLVKLTTKRSTVDEGRIKITLVNLNPTTNKAEQWMCHYANTDGLLLAMDDIVNEHFVLAAPTNDGSKISPVYMAKRQPSFGDQYVPIYEEYKGGFGSRIKKPEWNLYSSHLLIEFVWGDRGKAIKISMTWSEGVRTSTGAYKALNHNSDVSSSIFLPLKDCRVMAHKLGRHINNELLCQLNAMGDSLPIFGTSQESGDFAEVVSFGDE